MEAGRCFLSGPPQLPLRPSIRNCSSSASSVLLLHEQVTPALSPLSAALLRHPPSSILIQDRCDESRSSSCLEDDDIFQSKQTSDGRLMVVGPSSSPNQENKDVDPSRNVTNFQHRLLHRPELWYLWPYLRRKEESVLVTTEADQVVALAREALSACKEAASIFRDAKELGMCFDDDCTSLRGFTDVSVLRIVRSTRLHERANKKRRMPKHKNEILETERKPEPRRKSDEGYDPNDPLRLFLWGPETTQLLSVKEESDLIAITQELLKLQEVRSRLENQFSREPTIIEWAAALGMSCQSLQSQLLRANLSRDKLIYANFRMVVHIAKQYQGRGLSLQDLLQEGSMGLMRSVEKFKPHAGCRFATYAYWWIRQSIRKALFQHSRTIRLPENVYALLGKVSEAKKSCIQRGNHRPTKDDIAASAGMTVETLERLLYTARIPLSIQQTVWMDQDTTFQEITADTSIEVPDVSISKQLMRQHVRSLLGVLSPRERKIIKSRFGIEDGEQKSLSEIGAGFGLSKERVRQLESRALYKLKQCLSSHGLTAYSDMLV